MGDWADTVAKVAPGKKVYLFVGGVGVILDDLVARPTAGVPNVATVRPPLGEDSLSMLLGYGEQAQTIVIRAAEQLQAAEWTLVARYLEAYKAPGQSLVIVASELPDFDEVRQVKAKTRSGFYVQVADPTGEMGQKHLVQWIAEELSITTIDAEYVCQRAEYRLETLFWARQSYLAITGGKVLQGAAVRRLLDMIIPLSASEIGYRVILDKRRNDEVLAALTPPQALGLFKRLESALGDMLRLREVMLHGMSPKQIAAKSGLHIVRVLELMTSAPRYPPGTVLRCRAALALGFEQWKQPEAAQIVSRLWG